QVSMWNCTVQPDGAIRMGLRYVRGLREEGGRRITGAIGPVGAGGPIGSRNLPSHPRFSSLDELVQMAGLRQDEVRALALAGALTSFGGDRRAALWQAERAGRPAGPLIDDDALAGS